MNNRAPLAASWMKVATAWLPFADAASADLPLGRLLRLALFQVSVGMATVLLTGTLNRVMIVELSIPAGLVAAIIAVPLLVAPLRALIGHKSDTHRSVLGWRWVPYIWLGTLMQFGGLAIMPFALLLMSDPAHATLGVTASAFAFLLTGAGLHTTQTAGLALATDLAPEDKRPRAVALLYVMLLAGTMLAALVIGSLLVDFSATRLVQVIQGAAVVTLDLATLEPLEQQLIRQPTRMPYIPGLLSFRELPAAIAALESLERAPECLMVDGHGIAHPRRLGVAAHLGLWCDLPSFGVAKKRLCGKHGEPGEERGDWVALTDRVREADGELGIIENTELPKREQRSQLGAVLRSRAKVKPVFVSPGQRMNLDTALAMTLHCLGKTKLPEPTRLADQLASRRLKRLRDA